MLPKVAPWTRPVTDLPGIGPARAAMLERIGITTVGDVLLHLPRTYRSYVPYSTLTDVVQLPDGQGVIVRGRISASSVQRTRRNRHMAVESVTIAGGGDQLQARWFIPFRGPLPKPRFQRGQEVVVRGVLGSYGATRTLENAEPCDLPERPLIVPVYPLTHGISQRLMHSIVQAALERGAMLDAPLDAKQFPQLCHVSDAYIVSALRHIHTPNSLEEAELGRRVLALREILKLVRKNRLVELGPKVKTPMEPVDGPLVRRFLSALPFRPTGAQSRVMGEIQGDMAGTHGMRRVLCGDVGSGKSLIIAYALLKAVEAGGQGLLVAPTRILASQHVQTLERFFQGLGLRISYLTAELSAQERRTVLNQIRTGAVDVVVATHVAFEEAVEFKNLLVGAIDEQHRFGVTQRLALERKAPVHTMWVSATPIPKTMGQIIYGAVPISYLDERPPGRARVDTRWLPYSKRADVYRFVDKEVRSGGRAYVVCPAIEEDPDGQLPGAQQVYDDLKRKAPGGKPVELIHGRMPSADQDRALDRFVSGEVGTLVATSMVEVGVDVPEATVMVIEAADRFGLSQLHQLRGRVGRGDKQAYALLISDGPTEQARERLHALRQIDDGFRLAQIDLELRGPGEFTGLRQSGVTDLRFADFARDIDLFQFVTTAIAEEAGPADPRG